jgi:CheY-like chemotaxis protein
MAPKLEFATPPRVLIVDDDADIRESLATLLNEEGFAVRTAMNGRDALSVLEQIELPDVILLDLTMPVMDGNSFIASIGDHDPLADVPVIVVSAVPHRAAPGAAAVISKPINFDHLLTAIRRHCEPQHRAA